jgi:mannosyl-oligosaccharide glucosidase
MLNGSGERIGKTNSGPLMFYLSHCSSLRRSNLYFGLKHRSARSLSAGLMWFDYQTLQQSPDRFLRHWCDQNDRLKYGWTYHDGETFGTERITDENLHINIQWLKEVTGQHGGDWTARIHLTPQVCTD